MDLVSFNKNGQSEQKTAARLKYDKLAENGGGEEDQEMTEELKEVIDTQLALKVTKTQMVNLNVSMKELKTSPEDKPILGKRPLPLAVYEKNCLARIADLDRQMNNHQKSTLIWMKLRKRKLAQMSRLQNRRNEFSKNNEIAKIENLT